MLSLNAFEQIHHRFDLVRVTGHHCVIMTIELQVILILRTIASDIDVDNKSSQGHGRCPLGSRDAAAFPQELRLLVTWKAQVPAERLVNRTPTWAPPSVLCSSKDAHLSIKRELQYRPHLVAWPNLKLMANNCMPKAPGQEQQQNSATWEGTEQKRIRIQAVRLWCRPRQVV